MERNSVMTQGANYNLIDLLKFICAFLVIGIHTRPFQVSSDLLDRLFYYDISNYAVLFFYACTGYFLVAGSADRSLNERLSIRIKKVLRLYIIWSIIYAPLTLYGWRMEGKWKPIYLLLCVRNYIFVGENYYSWTLWYLNGLIFALILIKLLLKKYSIDQIFGLGSILYIVGIVLTMLHEHLESLPMTVACLIKVYFKLFATTRNGLFQSIGFVSLGMRIAEKEQIGKLRASLSNATIIGLAYIVKIACSLFGGQYISMLLDLPTFFLLFSIIILGCKKCNLKGGFYKRLRGMSESIYFIHMYFVAFCALVLYNENYHNFQSFFITAVGAFMVSWLVSLYKKVKK